MANTTTNKINNLAANFKNETTLKIWSKGIAIGGVITLVEAACIPMSKKSRVASLAYGVSALVGAYSLNKYADKVAERILAEQEEAAMQEAIKASEASEETTEEPVEEATEEEEKEEEETTEEADEDKEEVVEEEATEEEEPAEEEKEDETK